MRFNIQDPETKMVFEARVRWEFETKRRPVSKKLRQTTRAVIDIRPAGVITSAASGSRKWAWTEAVWLGEAHVHPLDVKEKRFNRVDGQRQALERAVAGQSDPVRELVMKAFRDMRRAADEASRASQVQKIKNALRTEPAEVSSTEKTSVLEALADALSKPPTPPPAPAAVQEGPATLPDGRKIDAGADDVL